MYEKRLSANFESQWMAQQLLFTFDFGKASIRTHALHMTIASLYIH